LNSWLFDFRCWLLSYISSISAHQKTEKQL
jgi:hypothetical protein